MPTTVDVQPQTDQGPSHTPNVDAHGAILRLAMPFVSFSWPLTTPKTLPI